MLDTRPPTAQDLLERLAEKARADFLPRALRDENSTHIQLDTLQDLHELGLLHVSASPENGGLGGSLLGRENPGLFVQALRRLARGDAAAAHCYQLHNHALWMLETMGTPRQIETILRPLTSRFGLLGFVGSEPGRASNKDPLQTRARKVEGGWRVNGVKSFVTNGTAADLILTSVAVETPAPGTSPADQHLSLMIDPSSEGVSIDNGWYRPNGMKTARSPLITLSEVFVPDSHLVGERPGVMPRGRWFAKFHLGFAANYIGSAEGLFAWYLDYTRARGRAGQPLVQLRTGEMRLALDAAIAHFEHAVALWQQGDTVEAELASMSAMSVVR
ncbi:acyl-CoA dehydrogenase family protein [Celeribacter indicus]|uniref:Dibenzothiophene monooxygenase n=1 Tax=Celeribacter indicus TaxID=1208324 RepID=A0A0B5E056_9RHOB|nr:acyl-CoA dehydrogenase family protein [Celeribacter indicus]AJE48634.1 Acyl-CoA dehydrogenase, C-terminal:Acyl-CoA dehydrogenase, central region:Acyl-CoA dehydrogenase, N-terminal:Acyl-CoA dehydrogenase, N-terminal [Celeribacter indicus]SDX51267.1 Acyl-CoA dehydrogenase [Celeribacter indicus]